LLKRYRKEGAAGLISKHRGRKAANRLSAGLYPFEGYQKAG